MPELWQVVTSLFVHLDLWSFFFNLLGLWFVGATIERQLGRTRFLMLFLVPAVLGNLVMAGMMLIPGRGSGSRAVVWRCWPCSWPSGGCTTARRPASWAAWCWRRGR